MLDENTLRRIEFLPSFVDPCGDQTSRGEVASRSLNLPYRDNCTYLPYFTLGKLFNVYITRFK